jgi:uncharacterized protein
MRCDRQHDHYTDSPLQNYAKIEQLAVRELIAMGTPIAELPPYNPTQNLHRVLSPDRWETAWTMIPQLSALLKQTFGATRVTVFGSLTDRSCYTRWSDIDLAAWDISPERFYTAIFALNELSPDFKVDLVDPQRCHVESLKQAIQREGIEV